MSIQIDQQKCIGCGKCCKVCPGNLINQDQNQKASIKYPKECWGCTACLKECPVGAIRYHLGLDIGGKGGYLYTEKSENYLKWHIYDASGTKHELEINQKESNKY